MSDKSASWPLFRQSANDLVLKLADSTTVEGRAMSREATELEATFKSWETLRPDNADRIAAIQQLFALNRRVMDFLAEHRQAAAKLSAPPPSGPKSPRR